MIDTINTLASKSMQVVQEVPAVAGSEKTSGNVKQQKSTVSSQDSQTNNSKTSDQIINQLNENLDVFNTRVSFAIDAETNKTVVQIIDNSNDKVIKQVPPEYLLKVSQSMTDLLGLMVDEKA
jgi:flagellar protein FlaG